MPNFNCIGLLTFGWVRINSPSAASRVYPLTPDPVDNTKLADEPYLTIN